MASYKHGRVIKDDLLNVFSAVECLACDLVGNYQVINGRILILNERNRGNVVLGRELKKLVGISVYCVERVVAVYLVGRNNVFLEVLAVCSRRVVLEAEGRDIKASAECILSNGDDVVVDPDIALKIGVVECSCTDR